MISRNRLIITSICLKKEVNRYLVAPHSHSSEGSTLLPQKKKRKNKNK